MMGNYVSPKRVCLRVANNNNDNGNGFCNGVLTAGAATTTAKAAAVEAASFRKGRREVAKGSCLSLSVSSSELSGAERLADESSDQPDCS